MLQKSCLYYASMLNASFVYFSHLPQMNFKMAELSSIHNHQTENQQMRLKAFSSGVIISLAIICSSCGGNKPSDSVIKSFRALEQGKIEEAMTEYSVNPFAEYAVKIKMSEVSTALRSMEGIKYNVKKEEISGETANVTIEMSSEKVPGKSTISFKLLKEKELWKIVDYSI